MDEARCPMADEKLGAAIENAVQRIPERYKVKVSLSRGDHDVCLTAKNGRVVRFFCNGNLAEAINSAVEWAENEG